MTPDEWIELAKKHVMTPEEVTEDELAALRTNYEIWDAAEEMVAKENRVRFAERCRIVKGSIRLDRGDWDELTQNGVVPDCMSEEQAQEVHQAFQDYSDVHTKVQLSRTKRGFLHKFDTIFETENGQPPIEVQEILWKTKAERLYKAIEDHRRAHVLANKQPNGLDFQLWSEADLEEFHASVHSEMAAKGYITFKEG